mmetsp:Transcript_84476/g.236450  ORF Transcript_84476/g.236450 Transcript_84476/m.236450 type:complete len:278 (-) Transcript_84476:1487-2320(-)
MGLADGRPRQRGHRRGDLRRPARAPPQGLRVARETGRNSDQDRGLVHRRLRGPHDDVPARDDLGVCADLRGFETQRRQGLVVEPELCDHRVLRLRSDAQGIPGEAHAHGRRHRLPPDHPQVGAALLQDHGRGPLPRRGAGGTLRGLRQQPRARWRARRARPQDVLVDAGHPEAPRALPRRPRPGQLHQEQGQRPLHRRGGVCDDHLPLPGHHVLLRASGLGLLEGPAVGPHTGRALRQPPHRHVHGRPDEMAGQRRGDAAEVRALEPRGRPGLALHH